MSTEIYKDIPRYEGLYQVSDLGNIKSLERKAKHSSGTGFRNVKESILKPCLNSWGYVQVVLHKGTRKKFTVQSLVAIVFHNHKPDGTQKLVVDHINGIKIDNRAENLQVITQRKNCSKDQKNGSSKYVGVYWNRHAKKWMSQIYINGKIKYLGSFTDEKEASIAYQNALKRL